ncbi:major facilitator superfamily domain-containing protein [Chaetomium fimeti]|uniref:Major facilitator superfamily domain-containing protein n=1 Tax=Chaetomium fimeti TaxID=1854472 RepID=A0AAE0HEX0_9PEZI|nr:major facilitator superfamily domain-containing protein [Chaetomium fimeti]
MTKEAHDEQNVEHSEPTQLHALTAEHREYLLQRHGTLDLEPVPDMTDTDPYNWPKSKKILNLAMIAFHAMMGTFTAAAVQSVFAEIAADLDVPIHQASYMLSLQIAVLGGAPLFWRPLSQRYGRRPVFLLSLLCSLVGNIGCAVSPSYGTMGLCRAITAFFISPALAIGSGVVTETFFKKERARYMGIWTMMVTLGVPMAPFILGFAAVRVGYRWIYWILAIFILYFLLGRETLYLRHPTPSTIPPTTKSSPPHNLLSFSRIDPTPLKAWDFVQPLTFAARPCVLIPTVGYAMVFLWGNIMMSVETGSLFPERFGFDPQQVGLQNISIIVGSLVGEQIGGFLSDWWMWRRHSKAAGGSGSSGSGSSGSDSDTQEGENTPVPQPEFRLWLSHPGYLLAICGVVVYLVQVERAGTTWNVTPLVGTGIAAAGNQIVTTVATTYAVDCYREDAAGVGVFINFVRQTWGFIGPFWFPHMIERVGFGASAGIAAGMIIRVLDQ